jgi:hypothetical protein
MTEDDRQFNPAVKILPLFVLTVNRQHISPRFCMPVRYLAHPQSEWIDDQYSAIAAECGYPANCSAHDIPTSLHQLSEGKGCFTSRKLHSASRRRRRTQAPPVLSLNARPRSRNPPGASQIIVTEHCYCLLVKRCRPQCHNILLKNTFHAGGNDYDSLGSRL